MSLSRRDFIKKTATITSAFTLAFYIPSKSKAEEQQIQKAEKDLKPNAFIRIEENNKITFIMGQAEMGQGVYTTVAMCIADELNAKWDDIHFEASNIDEVYYSVLGPWMVTAGSTSIRTKQLQYRKIGAAINIMLQKAAAKRWQIREFNLLTKDSKVINKKTKESFTYGELVSDLATMKIPNEPKLKKLDEYTIIGKPTRRHPKEAWEKVTGTATYGIDVRLDNMKYAAILRPTIFGAKVKKIDASSILNRPGIIKVKEIPSGVAIIADNWSQAREALYYITVEWENDTFSNISTSDLRKEYDQLLDEPGHSMRNDGDTKKAFNEASQVINAHYEFPFLAHAAMEPLNCTVQHTGKSAKMITGGQIQSIYSETCAKILNINPQDVDYHNTYLGGGFGRRAASNLDYISDAVYVAKNEEWPIMTLWTREDDIKMGNYRPMYKNRASVALNSEGKITGFKAKVVGQSVVNGTILDFLSKGKVDWAQWDGLSDHLYDIESNDLRANTPKSPIPVLWWRSVGHTQSAPMVEGIVDQAAYAAKIDPIEYRMNMIDDIRAIKILEDVQLKSNWKKRKKERNVGFGVSIIHSFGTVIAQVAQVRVTENDFKVEKVWCSVDCGFAFNPLNVENQMISGINFGLSAIKYSEITILNGETEQSNFYDYQVARISDVPEIEVSIVNSNGEIGGIGEPGVPPIFAAVSNAIFDATGKRYHSYPIKIS
jgi:isoquinoline 1-oxidoreductase beta subunit